MYVCMMCMYFNTQVPANLNAVRRCVHVHMCSACMNLYAVHVRPSFPLPPPPPHRLAMLEEEYQNERARFQETEQRLRDEKRDLASEIAALRLRLDAQARVQEGDGGAEGGAGRSDCREGVQRGQVGL
jgi:hypothetical protein